MGSLNQLSPVAAVGGTDITSLALNALDLATLGSELDPDGIETSAATASDVSTITMAEISSGSNDYSLVSGTNFRQWRKYTTLKDDDGVAIVGADTAIVILEIDNSGGNFSGDGPTQLFFGICADPTSTTQTTVSVAGMIEEHLDAASSPRYAAAAYSGLGTVLTNSSNTSARCVVYLQAGEVSEPQTVVTGTTTYGPSNRDANKKFGASDPVYLMVSAGTRSTGTLVAGDQIVAVLRYRVIKLST